MGLTFARKNATPFEAELGRALGSSGGGRLREAVRTSGDPRLPSALVVREAHGDGRDTIELERSVCERLEHPGLVRYLGAASKDGETLLAFERLGGNPLVLLSGEGSRPSFRDPGTTYFPLPPGRALELAFDLLLAIEHLHEQGFVHGDVKLANLLVRTSIDGAATGPRVLEEVSLGNFQGVLAGLGSVRSAAILDQVARGEADASLLPDLTPACAPPEALLERAELGGRKVVSPAADIYGFGLVLYALLTGRVPYEHLDEPDALASREVVLELKSLESKGQVSPVAPGAFDDLPLDDVAFESSPDVAWPAFRSAIEHAVARSIDLDPRRRIGASAARAFFEARLGMKESPAGETRGWSQTLFQMRPRSNRLTGNAPIGGLRIKEDGDELLVEESAKERPKKAEEGVALASDRSVILHTSDRMGKTVLPTAKDRKTGGRAQSHFGLVALADVLRDFQDKKPLPEAPWVLTRSGLGPRDLARCLVFSLGEAHATFRVHGEGSTLEKEVTVGRADGNDLVLADTAVSKKHLSFKLREDAWWVHDLGSANGTFVDGELVKPKSPVRLRKELSTIGVGPDSNLTFLAKEEIERYLRTALDVWAQAFEGKRKPRSAPRSDSVVQRPAEAVWPPPAEDPGIVSSVLEAWPPRPGTGTEVITRGGAPEPPLAFSAEEAWPPRPLDIGKNPTRRVSVDPLLRQGAPRVDDRARSPEKRLPEDLAARLRDHIREGSRITLVLEGSRVERVDTIPEALAVIAVHGDAVMAVEVQHSGGERIVVFLRETS